MSAISHSLSNLMNCSLPAPRFYVSLMHNIHFISTPIYIITLVALFRENSHVFRTYKYYIIVHILINIASEMYVTFMWVPMTYLPHDVYRTTGWLAQLGVSGILQFYILAQFIIFIGLSILEMFYHRFKVVVIHYDSFILKMPKYGLFAFRTFTVIHLMSITLSTIDSRTLVYQQTKRDQLLQKFPNLPKEIGCYTVFILTHEDVILLANVAIYGILVAIGTTLALSTVFFINHYLNKARNLSKETKKLQKVLILSLFAQSSIHVVMIIVPDCFQIYEVVFILYNDDLSYGLLLCVAYHGFVSTCSMIVFTKQIRQRVFQLPRFCRRQRIAVIPAKNQVGGPFSYIESAIK